MRDEMLDSGLLEKFIPEFFGYGNLAGHIWFIGMEEGGGTNLQEVRDRLNIWEKRGRRRVEDANGYHVSIGMGRLFGPNAEEQRTWAKLIRVILAYQNAIADIAGPITQDQVRRYQASQFGDPHAPYAFLELFPLPSPGIGVWNYGAGQAIARESWTNIGYLQTRVAYRRHVAPVRIQSLRALIDAHRPNAVICYGKSYRRYWNRLAGFNWPAGGELYKGPDFPDTRFMLLPHPTPQFRQIPNAVFEQAGTTIARTIG